MLERLIDGTGELKAGCHRGTCRPHKRSLRDVRDLARHFQNTRCFMYGLPINGLEALCRRLSFVHVSPGCMLLRQGQPGDSMFMVISGTAHILQRYGSLSTEHGRVSLPNLQFVACR